MQQVIHHQRSRPDKALCHHVDRWGKIGAIWGGKLGALEPAEDLPPPGGGTKCVVMKIIALGSTFVDVVRLAKLVCVVVLDCIPGICDDDSSSMHDLFV